MTIERTYSLTDLDEHWKAVHQATLIFVRNEDQVLLIRKKRGLGAGKINGPGGKLEGRETAQACAHRELHEELCVTVSTSTNHGRLRFQFTDHYSIDVQVFVAEKYTGVPTETEEAIPLWFNVTDIPYTEMWEDDAIWLPRVLAGERVNGRFIFDGDAMVAHDVNFETVHST